MRNDAAITWLKIASAITVGFGFLIAMGASPATDAPAAFLLDLIYFPVDRVPEIGGAGARLVSAICGGVMVGWGFLLWLVATRLAPKDPELAKGFVLISLTTWFVVDSAGSVAAGAPLNVAGNLIFLVMFIAPAMRIGSKSHAPA